MNSEDYNKTGTRRSPSEVSCDTESEKIVDKVEEAYVEAEQPPAETKMGRPKGAKNKRSDALLRYQQERHGTTVGEMLSDALFDGYNHHAESGQPPGLFLEKRAAVMAWRMGISMADALKHVRAMANDLMPYVHQKLPVALEVEGKGIAIAVFTPDGGFAPHTGGPLDLRPAQARHGPGDAAATIEVGPNGQIISNNDENPAQSDE